MGSKNTPRNIKKECYILGTEGSLGFEADVGEEEVKLLDPSARAGGEGYVEKYIRVPQKADMSHCGFASTRRENAERQVQVS